jgi:hypothetical protein
MQHGTGRTIVSGGWCDEQWHKPAILSGGGFALLLAAIVAMFLVERLVGPTYPYLRIT